MKRTNRATSGPGHSPNWQWLAGWIAVSAIVMAGCDKAEELAEKTKKELEREVESLQDKNKKEDADKSVPSTPSTPDSSGGFSHPGSSPTANQDPGNDSPSTPATNGASQPSFQVDPNADPAQVMREFAAKSSRQIGDRDLAQLAALKSGKEQITILNLGGSDVTAEGIKYLEQLPYVVELSLRSLAWPKAETLGPVLRQVNLVNLDLSHTRIVDADLAVLAPLKKLRELNLDSIPITDAGLSNLAALASLEKLSIGLNRQLDGSGFAQLASLNLRELSADESSIGLKGLEFLKDQESLQALNLTGASVTNETLEHLRECGNLRLLVLDANRIDSQGMSALSRLRKLEYLSMRMTGISNSGLAHLKGCKQLKTLVLGNPTDVTFDGENALRQFIPRLQIEY